MSRTLRNLINGLTGAPKVPDGPAGVPPIPPSRNLPPPPGGKNLPPPPPAPPARNLPGPTAPDAPSNGGGWGTAAKVGLALATGGGVLGALNALTPDSKGPPIPPPGGPQPPAPPAAPPAPPIDPKTATREELLNAGYRDYGSGLVPPGGNALGVPDHWRRKIWLKDQAKKYGRDIAKNPALYGDMVAAYDQAPTGAGSGHSARAVAARALTDHLDAQRSGQIQVNVENRAKQFNMARQMGVPVGYVQAMEDVAAHAARGDLASASAAAAMYGQVYGQSFLYAARNLTDQHNASEKAKAEMAGQKPPQPTVTESVTKNLAQIQAMPPGPERKAAIEQFYTTANKGDAKAAKPQIENHYQTIIKDMATRLDKLSPEEMSELQQVAGHMGYSQFLKYAGLTDTLDNQRHFQRIFNKNASWAQFGDNLGVGNVIRGITPWVD